MTFWMWLILLVPIKARSSGVFQDGGSVSPHSVKVGGLKPEGSTFTHSVPRNYFFLGTQICVFIYHNKKKSQLPFCHAVHQLITVIYKNESRR